MAIKRRALVFGNALAAQYGSTGAVVGHPFRQQLPAHVLQPLPPEPKSRFAWFAMTDWRDFLMAYCAMFMAVSTFIA